jgi:glyoxylate reductase
MKVFITRRIPPIAREILSQKYEVSESIKNEPYPPDQLPYLIENYDILLTTITERFDKKLLGLKGRLKLISNFAVGLDNIDVEYANSRGIAVYNTPDIVTNSTADLTIALLLALIRKISFAAKYVQEDKWKAWDPELFLGEELTGKTFGIIGFGKIGRAVARRATSFGLNVIFNDNSNYINKMVENPLFRQVSIDELYKTADYISIHLPLTEVTRGMINENAFRKMIRKPVILNIARGDIVNTDDLVVALDRGYIRGAGLDVTSPEPIPGDHPLCQYSNCIVVPHIGTATLECRFGMAKMAAENIVNHFERNESYE